MTREYGCDKCNKKFFTIEGSIIHQIFKEDADWKNILSGWKLVLPRLVITRGVKFIGKWLFWGVVYLLYGISYILSNIHAFIEFLIW